uniref:Uncharacterized protein n=1 Tax=Triticum urartu TaxID=4572 RepID=A0A8R7QTF4_TRIUA
MRRMRKPSEGCGAGRAVREAESTEETRSGRAAAVRRETAREKMERSPRKGGCGMPFRKRAASSSGGVAALRMEFLMRTSSAGQMVGAVEDWACVERRRTRAWRRRSSAGAGARARRSAAAAAAIGEGFGGGGGDARSSR